MADAVNSTSAPIAVFPHVFPRFDLAEPMPGLAERPYRPLTMADRLAIERDMAGVYARLAALLASSGSISTRSPASTVGGVHV